MPAYVIVDAEVSDPVAYETYKKLSGPALAANGGKFLARGGAVAVLEGSWSPTRVVIAEFPTVEAARRWYDSPEYGEARQARAGSARMNILVVEGL
ncbi:DUF1330 domain-containing protein [uncultured Gammaproteobacteria bacterium]